VRQIPLVQMSSQVIICSAPGKRQRAQLRARRDDDEARLDHAIAHARGVRTGKDRVAANDLDAATSHQAPERAGDVADHLLLAVDEYCPI
jgi:hypothetical protein